MSPAERRIYALALGAELVGAGGALLIGLRPWQTVLLTRPRPLGDELLPVSGHTLDGAITGFSLVALAGVVAVLATRGVGRRLVGTLVALSGALLVWRAVGTLSAVSDSRARTLVTQARTAVGVSSSSPVRISVHPVWPVLTIVAGLLVTGSGLLVALRSGRWAALSARYEPPAAASAPPATDEAMWTALDRGDDPTAAN